MLAKTMQRWGEEFAADNDGHSLMNLIWYRSYEWDEKEASNHETEDCEYDFDRLCQAVDFYNSNDIPNAIEIWLDLAEKGSALSMLELGRCYEFGRGVTLDRVEAEKWYEKAFQKGSQSAMLKCADAAASRNEFSSCEAILQGGIDQDWTPAIFWMAWYRHKRSADSATYRSIFPMLRKAAGRGHPAANFFLTNYMVRGKFGIVWIPLGFLRAIRFGVGIVGKYD